MAIETIYVLIKAKAGKVVDVSEALEKIEGVEEADMVTGRYDIAAVIRGGDLNRMLATVVAKIQKIEGIESTETLVAVPKYSELIKFFE